MNHWSSGRCWCDDFHGDQPTTLPLSPPPVVPGRPLFDLAREVRQAVN